MMLLVLVLWNVLLHCFTAVPIAAADFAAVLIAAAAVVLAVAWITVPSFLLITGRWPG